MRRHLTSLKSDDSGVALVLAMGIALIGIAVAGIVVTMVITASNDSGRDRTRTAEIHSAEGAVDATMALLAYSSPCPAPFDPLTVGNGAQQTQVAVNIDYSDDLGAIPCSTDGLPSRIPSKAVITATSTSPNESIGVQPVRKLQAGVDLTPRVTVGQNAAIFSEGNLNTNASFNVLPKISGESADIWVDKGSWSCGGGNKTVNLAGAVYMPAGDLTVGSNCIIGGDVWLQDGLTVTSGNGSSFGKNLTVRSAGVTVNGDIGVIGNVRVGGAKGGNKDIIAGGSVQYGVGSGAIADLVSVDLPGVNYEPNDWAPPNVPTAFVTKDQNHFATAAGISACDSIKNVSPTVKLPETGTTPTIYNLMTCSGGLQINKATIALYADVAIFASSVTVTTTLNFVSGDGFDHKLWIIVPESTGSGSIDVKALSMSKELSSFWYAPGLIDINPGAYFRGQIYGGEVNLRNGDSLIYDNVGVPGVELVAAVTYEDGYEVALSYKREVS